MFLVSYSNMVVEMKECMYVCVYVCTYTSVCNQFHSDLAINEILSPQFLHHPRIQCCKVGCCKFRSFSIFICKDNIFMARGFFMNSGRYSPLILCFLSFFFTSKLRDILYKPRVIWIAFITEWIRFLYNSLI